MPLTMTADYNADVSTSCTPQDNVFCSKTGGL